jgi:hypothetical protein
MMGWLLSTGREMGWDKNKSDPIKIPALWQGIIKGGINKLWIKLVVDIRLALF